MNEDDIDVDRPIPGPGSHGMDECIKTGIFFTVPGSQTGLYTGDLFYNMAVKKFRISGIPSNQIGLRHTMAPEEKGPMAIHLYVSKVLGVSVPDANNYSTLEFTEAHAAGDFMAWMEEWWMGRSALEAAHRYWTVSDNQLVWVRD